MRKQKAISILVIVLLFVFYGSFLAHKINLVTADLGRHIRNGEYLFRDAAILTTNFYSYTEAEYATFNHHWGSGLIFYLLDKVGGITLVHLFFIALSLGTFAIFFWIAVRLTNPPSPALPTRRREVGVVSLVSLPMIFLLAERTEIRPEAFSYFFAGLFLMILYKFRNPLPQSLPTRGRERKGWIFALPFLQILWANTHIFFILGPIIIGAFLMESLYARRELFWKLAGIFALTSAASLLNPFGITGALSPFTILREFGYRLAENQTVFFMLERSADPVLRIFPFVFFAVMLSFIPAIYRLRKAYPIVNLFMFAGFSFLAWFQIRNIAFFGFVALPILAFNLKTAFRGIRETKVLKTTLVLLAVILIIGASGNLFHRFPYWRQFGFGEEPGNSKAMEFFKEQKIAGPIFNNYDIGGYLIYHLFPQERVFVDNRPEAYSVKFFQDEYVPLQQNEELWTQGDERYQFNAVVFSHLDATPWGQNFLVHRVKDPAWAAVYLDPYVIIMLKRNGQNESIIKVHEKIINNNSGV